eukprot:gene1344-biopygen13339
MESASTLGAPWGRHRSPRGVVPSPVEALDESREAPWIHPAPQRGKGPRREGSTEPRRPWLGHRDETSGPRASRRGGFCVRATVAVTTGPPCSEQGGPVFWFRLFNGPLRTLL